MKNTYVYGILFLLFLASVGAVLFLPGGDLAKAVAALPAAGAVIAALFQLIRDQLAQDRALSLQASQHSFEFGATSHMATVAFDKHVCFSEEYVAEVFTTLSTLFREGPSDQVLAHAGTLYKIRERWAVWLTPAIDTELDKFEAALRKIGANAHFVEVDLAPPNRSKAIDEMYAVFAEVTGMTEWEGKPVTADRAIRTIIETLRAVLGIAELTRLRQKLVMRALTTAG